MGPQDLRRTGTERLGLRAPLGVVIGHRDGAAVEHEHAGEHESHRSAAEHADLVGIASACDGVDGGAERLGHRGACGLEVAGDRMQRGRRRGDPLGERAEHPARSSADLGPAGVARGAGATRDRVRDQHALAGVLARARRLVAERARVRG